MITLIVLLAALFLLGLTFAHLAISESRSRRATRQSAAIERLRIQHEQFVAERRMQQVVSDGLTWMLREARNHK